MPPGTKKTVSTGDCAGPEPPSPHPLPAAGPPRLRGAQGSPLGWPSPANTWTQKRKNPDAQHRKDTGVLKNHTEPAQSPNLGNAKGLRQETRPLPRAGHRGPQSRLPGQGTQHPAAGHGTQPLGSEGGGAGQTPGFQVDSPGCELQPLPQGHDPLWHKQGGVGPGQKEQGHPGSSGTKAQGGIPGQARGLSLAPGLRGRHAGTGGASGWAPGSTEPSGGDGTERAAPPQGLGRRAPSQAHRVTKQLGAAPEQPPRHPPGVSTVLRSGVRRLGQVKPSRAGVTLPTAARAPPL